MNPLSEGYLALLAGKTVVRPISSLVAQAFVSASIQQYGNPSLVKDTDAPLDTMTMIFRMEKRASFRDDFDILSANLLKPGNRVQAHYLSGARSTRLFDGIILDPDPEFGDSDSPTRELHVHAHDLRYATDRNRRSANYPDRTIASIVRAILKPYVSRFQAKLVVDIRSTAAGIGEPTTTVNAKDGSDLSYLNKLAKAFNSEFIFRADPVSTFYFGSRPIGRSFPAINWNLGPASNVESLSGHTHFDQEQAVEGAIVEPGTGFTLPFSSRLLLDRLPESLSALVPINPLSEIVNVVKPYGGNTTARWYEAAKGKQARSQLTNASLEGTLDVRRYGQPLAVGASVGLRGVGFRFDGPGWRVEKLTHEIQRGAYTQQFTLNRDGLGSLSKEVGG